MIGLIEERGLNEVRVKGQMSFGFRHASDVRCKRMGSDMHQMLDAKEQVLSWKPKYGAKDEHCRRCVCLVNVSRIMNYAL